MTTTDTVFAGSIPAIYERFMVPMKFEPYAADVAERAKQFHPADILETAAGTGVVTQALHRAVPDANIIATDLNPAMLEMAVDRLRSSNVRYQAADAQDLPFDDQSFDLVVCQFGVMFFPDKLGRQPRGVPGASARRALPAADLGQPRQESGIQGSP